jgi:D-alanine-D-alanine ligase
MRPASCINVILAVEMASLAIGLVYDLLGTLRASADPASGAPADADAEFEPESTIEVLEGAIEALGHRPVRVGSPHALLAALANGEAPEIDVALNLAEGYGSRNREAWAPVLLEMAGVPCLGSDALTLSVTLDKAWARTLVADAGVPVPAGAVAASEEEARNLEIPVSYPLFVKPRWEGTSKGIAPSSKVEDRAALVCEVGRVVRDYRQPALIEDFLEGAEYTVTVIGNDPPRALPALQRALEVESRIGLHALEPHPAPEGGWQHCLPGTLDAKLEATLSELALAAWHALECRDFARADFRLDAEGRPHFLEMNPLPSFARDGSFGILAELEGRRIEELLAEVIASGLVRVAFS